MSLSLINRKGRAAARRGDRFADVAEASGGRLPSDPMEVLARFEEFCSFAEGLTEGAFDGNVEEI
jgi:hypothetical protein